MTLANGSSRAGTWRNDDGFLYCANHSAQTIDVFTDEGSDNPTYRSLGSTDTFTNPTAPDGEYLVHQVHHPDGRIATAHVFTVKRGSECFVEMQIIVANSPADAS